MPMLNLPVRWRTPWHARAAIANQLKTRHFLRIHALLLFLWTFGVGYLVSASLLAIGYDKLWERYGLTAAVAYLSFLFGVRIWLTYVGAIHERLGNDLGSDFNIDFLGSGNSSGGGNLPVYKGGGGTFDGAGASANFDGASTSLEIPLMETNESANNLLSGVDDLSGADIGDGFVPVLLIGLVLLVAALLFALIGPEFLIEVAFESVLAGSLVSAMRLGREPDWMWAVVRKTAWIFLLVLLVVVMFGKYAQKHYPEAKTFKEVMHHIMPHDASTTNKKKQ
jgi:hypothetical protein